MTDGVREAMQEGLSQIDLMAYEITETPTDPRNNLRAGIIRKLTAELQNTLQTAEDIQHRRKA